VAFLARFEVDAERQRGTFTTEVQFLDTLCCAYFALVKPFHKRVIPAVLSPCRSSRALFRLPIDKLGNYHV